MSVHQRHIKLQSKINYEEHYAFEKPTTATFISTETMETKEEKEIKVSTLKTMGVRTK